MYLRSLEMQGVKSFPDKIKLEFNKGISAVVGPNGSGKSNIGDAMRWVMGEQSSKTLRGGKMEDVIFNGTKNRPAAGFAQVTLTIDNGDRALNYENDIVYVSRKLYRNGDSEYLINGNQSRLKDVVELFMDTGLGRDGYSIIGQGRIADIVSSKSTERREIFEEAAGISKFRYKKEEAERKLRAAEDNIARLTDILAEIEDRIGPLQRQCEKAKKFKVLYDRKTELEIAVWVSQIHTLGAAIDEYKEKYALLDKQYRDVSDEVETLENKVQEAREQGAEKSAFIDSLRDEIHSIELESSQAGSNIAIKKNDISHLNEAIEKLGEQISQSDNTKYFYEAELKEKQELLQSLNDKGAALEKEIAECEKELSELSEKSDSFDKSYNETVAALNSLYIKKSELAYKLESSKNTASEIEESISALLDDRKYHEERSRLSENELKKLEEQNSANEKKLEEINNRINGIKLLSDNKNKKLRKAEDDLSESTAALQKVTQRLAVISDLEKSMEGFASSVKTVLKASSQGRISGICGTVAQLLKASDEYALAVETALGAALQNIVVENEDSAKRSINLLKEMRAGRATFLPLTSIKGRTLSEVPEDEEGFIAVASELVKYDKKYENIVSDLLGRICIAEDIDSAARIAKKHNYKFKIVTLDGQVVNAGGSFTGGSASKGTGLLSRKNEIDRLTSEQEELKEKNSKLRSNKEMLSQECAKLTADMDGARELLSEANSEKIRLGMEIKRVREFAEQYSEQLEKTCAELERQTIRLSLEQKEYDEIADRLLVSEKDIAQAEELVKTSQDEQNSLRSERERSGNALTEIQLRRIELLKDVEACELAIKQAKDNIEGSSSDKQQLADEIEADKAEIEKILKEIKEIEASVSTSYMKIDSIKKQINIAQGEHLKLDNRAEKLRQEQRIKTDERERLSNEANRIEEKSVSASNDYDRIVGKLWDDYELTVTEAENRAVELEDQAAAAKELAELRSKISSLGNVNLEAIEEYANVSGRYRFMNEQLGDVTKSKAELEELIGSLTSTMEEMFVDSFEKINKNFKQTFAELFGGGTGELLLTDPDNVLDCGIDIKVEPQGKIIKNLLSLSGGEQAFVAICIYFSILKIRPSPFCLLDEIEAALDDSNVERYAKYLHRFTDTTQFIAITHRRGTMEEADVLYGVTMQEKGISKLLKMDPGDAINMKLDENE